MSGRHNPAVRWLLTSLCLAFARLAAWAPLPIARAAGIALARVAYYVVPKIRRVGFANLERAYGNDITRREKRRILQAAVRNLGIVAAEFARLPRVSEAFLAEHVRCKGLDRLVPGRGCLLLGAHLGNWEWMAGVVAVQGIEIAEVVRPFDDPRMDDYVDGMRRASGVETIGKARAGPEIVKRLRAGETVGILIDQSPRENGVPVTFFGQPCWATVAPIVAASRARVPVHAVAMIREPSGRYTFEVLPEIPLAHSGNLRDDVIVNAQRCQDAVETLVRAHPEQWLWLHRRWKPRPALERKWNRANQGRT